VFRGVWTSFIELLNKKRDVTRQKMFISCLLLVRIPFKFKHKQLTVPIYSHDFQR